MAEQKLDLHTRYHLIFDIEAKVNQWRKNISPTNGFKTIGQMSIDKV